MSGINLLVVLILLAKVVLADTNLVLCQVNKIDGSIDAEMRLGCDSIIEAIKTKNELFTVALFDKKDFINIKPIHYDNIYLMCHGSSSSVCNQNKVVFLSVLSFLYTPINIFSHGCQVGKSNDLTKMLNTPNSLDYIGIVKEYFTAMLKVKVDPKKIDPSVLTKTDLLDETCLDFSISLLQLIHTKTVTFKTTGGNQKVITPVITYKTQRDLSPIEVLIWIANNIEWSRLSDDDPCYGKFRTMRILKFVSHYQNLNNLVLSLDSTSYDKTSGSIDLRAIEVKPFSMATKIYASDKLLFSAYLSDSLIICEDMSVVDTIKFNDNYNACEIKDRDESEETVFLCVKNIWDQLDIKGYHDKCCQWYTLYNNNIFSACL